MDKAYKYRTRDCRDMEEAFSLAREANRPIVAHVPGEPDCFYFPSGYRREVGRAYSAMSNRPQGA